MRIAAIMLCACGASTGVGIDAPHDGGAMALVDSASCGPAWYWDRDHDGWGQQPVLGACERPADATEQNGDCDDGEPLRNPGQPEICGTGSTTTAIASATARTAATAAAA